MDVSSIWCKDKLTLQNKEIKKSTITATSMEILATPVQRVSMCIYVILKLYYVGNQGSHDVKLQVIDDGRVRYEWGAVSVL